MSFLDLFIRYDIYISIITKRPILLLFFHFCYASQTPSQYSDLIR